MNSFNGFRFPNAVSSKRWKFQYSFRTLLALGFIVAIGITWWFQWKQSQQIDELRDQVRLTDSHLSLHKNLLAIVKGLDQNDQTHLLAKSFILEHYSQFYWSNITQHALPIEGDIDWCVLIIRPLYITHFGHGLVAAIVCEGYFVDLVWETCGRFEEMQAAVVELSDGSGHALEIKTEGGFSPPTNRYYSINSDGFVPVHEK